MVNRLGEKDELSTVERGSTPELRKKKDIAAYRATIKAIQALCKKINKNNNVVTQSDLTQAKQLHETFQQQNEELQSELEKLF